jgi:hypothetical protein
MTHENKQPRKNEGDKENNMKKLTILATIAVLAICGSAMALTVQIQGTVTLDDVVIASGAGENIGVNPLIELNVNGVVAAQTTVGAGFFFGDPLGQFVRSALAIDAGLNDVLTLTCYSGPTTGAPFKATSIALTVDTVSGGTGDDYIYDFGTTNIPVPEPSMLLSGLALLLLRRKK